ncbi:sugar ABC transporter substrate-binding protein [Stigmatella sp. ncwal1]|uniref:Sugar ABC transporter substrate-binding protein n=1 Tax=Stigmatella ashevillensis TaxID=2995309 RepID=A0ABT5DJI4_9BACT|nr:sugar ABC transporter substrate-binding protein [Stigmatella ashevillena]MDC0713820.1 sugar ABC transporter substrate-binding protein [Stigmatella ashevillena]
MKRLDHVRIAALGLGLLLGTSSAHAQTFLTIGTVNNGDMVRMQTLAKAYEAKHPDVRLNWVVLDENTLRQRLTTDITTSGGQFDVVTIGAYEAPMWGRQNWLTELKNLPASYEVEDLMPNVRKQLSVEGRLYAVPFYSEGSITYYRTDLFAAKQLTMPAEPTWEDIRGFAEKLHEPARGIYGICLRGKAGWGENMALVTTMVNAFGGRWFDEHWEPEIDSPEWHKAVNFYVDLLSKFGPPGPSSNGFNENLALFNSGKCGMWVDASVAGAFVTDRTQSQVPDKAGFAKAPRQVTAKGSSWLWTWALSIPASSRKQQAALDFILWATSKEYGQLVAERYGISAMPPGTRLSTYANQAYLSATPFAEVTQEAILTADPTSPSIKPVPYVGVQFATIPEFQAVASLVGRQISGALAGNSRVDKILHTSQGAVRRTMKRAGYYDKK